MGQMSLTLEEKKDDCLIESINNDGGNTESLTNNKVRYSFEAKDAVKNPNPYIDSARREVIRLNNSKLKGDQTDA